MNLGSSSTTGEQRIIKFLSSSDAVSDEGKQKLQQRKIQKSSPVPGVNKIVGDSYDECCHQIPSGTRVTQKCKKVNMLSREWNDSDLENISSVSFSSDNGGKLLHDNLSNVSEASVNVAKLPSLLSTRKRKKNKRKVSWKTFQQKYCLKFNCSRMSEVIFTDCSSNSHAKVDDQLCGEESDRKCKMCQILWKSRSYPSTQVDNSRGEEEETQESVSEDNAQYEECISYQHLFHNT